MQSTEALQIGHFLRNEVANFSFSGGNFASTFSGFAFGRA